MIFFIICWVTTTMATLIYVPHMAQSIRSNPWLFVLPLINMLAVANIPREIHHGRAGRAFVSSCVAVFTLLATFGMEMYPNLLLSNPEIANSLTAYNAASSEKTLSIMLIIAAIGMPIVIAYTISIYWIIRAKVQITESSYERLLSGSLGTLSESHCLADLLCVT